MAKRNATQFDACAPHLSTHRYHLRKRHKNACRRRAVQEFLRNELALTSCNCRTPDQSSSVVLLYSHNE
jgi:hypothetical protein